VYGYLRDFLFPEERARSPVKALSGGERNRLLLARLFTKPANVLILDEPTNDLDLETLDLLEAELIKFPGTILVVSHDRAFLDNVVTSTLVFEGQGRIEEFVGGCEDWLRQRQAAIAEPKPAPAMPSAGPTRPQPPAPGAKKAKRSFKEQREYDDLPKRIEALEAEHRELQRKLDSPEFYRGPGADVKRAVERLAELQQLLLNAYARWDVLDSASKTAPTR
jgi:ATP-binding cassette subfamily F protein uup